MRVLVLANPAAGAQLETDAFARVAEDLARAGHVVQVEETAQAGHARELARELASGFDRVVACGGDGTVSEVARGIIAAGATTPLAIAPAGTGNDLATALGIELPPDQAIRLAIEGRVVRVDVGLADEQPFVNAASIGPWAEIASGVRAGVKAALGPLSYLAAGLKPGAMRPFPARLSGAGAEIEGDMLYVAVANGPSVGGGSLVAPDARLDDGELDAVVLPALPAGELLAAARALRSGTPHDALVRIRAADLSLESDEELTLTCDGEPQRKRGVHFRVLPLALAIVVPGPRKELTPLALVP